MKALLNKGASLLPAGIKSVKSKFKAGDSVELIDHQSKKIIAKGISLFSHNDLKRIMGKHSDEITNVLGEYHQSSVVVHRDDMVIY